MTLQKTPASGFRQPLMHALVLSFTLLAAAAAHAQAPNLPRQAPPPSRAQIEQNLRATLLCEWPMDQAAPRFGEFWYVHRHLVKQHEANPDPKSRARDNQEGTNTLGAFEVFGIHFDEIKVAGFMGGGAGLAWSATGDKEALLEDKRRNGGGFRLKIRIHPDGPLIGWDLERGVGTAPDGSKFHHAGGDFQEAYIYNGKVLRKGWFIHPKTGRRIETDY